MKKPNFFIIGAPKCGTTALADYLAAHPHIWFSPLKEPHFFTAKEEGRNFFDLEGYLKLFGGADERHRAVGEGSVLYLYSKCAVQNILQFNPEARLIVMLRHPVDMFFSLHQHNLFGFRETVRDPQAAWELQKERAEGRSLPRGCREPGSLQYQAICSLGTQLERLFEAVARDQVLVLSLDEFANRPRDVYERVLRFLGVEADGRCDFPRQNTAKVHRSRLLARVLSCTSYTRRPIFGQCVATARSARTVALLARVRRVLEQVKEWNTRPQSPVADPAFAAELHEVFAEEACKIKRVTGFDLHSRYPGKRKGEVS